MAIEIASALELPTFTQILDFVGTFAFAISGIRLASAKHFDLFGAYVVGLTTAVGGGTMRDVMLGLTPFWMTNSFYLICSALALLWVLIFGKQLIRQEVTWFLFDTIGLALFTIVGIEKTLQCGLPWWTAIIMGTMTGAAGGMLRDVFINEVPLIFRKEIYALACVIGGAAYTICRYYGCDEIVTSCMCGGTVILIRCLAVKYKLSLPMLKGEEATPQKRKKKEEA